MNYGMCDDNPIKQKKIMTWKNQPEYKKGEINPNLIHTPYLIQKIVHLFQSCLISCMAKYFSGVLFLTVAKILQKEWL